MERNTTSPTEQECEAVQGLLSEHVAGVLTIEEVARVERHMAECADCRVLLGEVAGTLRPLFDLLADDLGVGPEWSPARRPALWDRVANDLFPDGEDCQGEVETREDPLALIRGCQLDVEVFAALDKAGVAQEHLRSLAPWVDAGVPGVRARVLHRDLGSDRQLVLVRMDAGVGYPAHRHHAEEVCFVLEGDLGREVVEEGTCVDLRIRAGDVMRMEAGSEHGVQDTMDGCLLLLIGSCRDAA